MIVQNLLNGLQGSFYKYYEDKLTCIITLKLIILVLDSVQTFLAC